VNAPSGRGCRCLSAKHDQGGCSLIAMARRPLP
jgi:hypothetical protein